MKCPVHDIPMKWETMTEGWSVEYCPKCRESQYANLNDMERTARRKSFMKKMGIIIEPQVRVPML